MFVLKTLVVHCMVMQYCQPLVTIYGVFLVVSVVSLLLQVASFFNVSQLK